jgi:hypothetical protein
VVPRQASPGSPDAGNRRRQNPLPHLRFGPSGVGRFILKPQKTRPIFPFSNTGADGQSLLRGRKRRSATEPKRSNSPLKHWRERIIPDCRH